MPDSIGPVPAVDGAPAAQPVRAGPGRTPSLPEPPTPSSQEPAATTGGTLSGAYSQLVINPDTHDVVIRIRDAATDRVLSEYPSSEVEHLAMFLKQYAETLARRRAAQATPVPGSGDVS